MKNHLETMQVTETATNEKNKNLWLGFKCLLIMIGFVLLVILIIQN